MALVTGREDPSKGRRFVNFRKLAGAVDTLIIYMGASTAGEIARELLEGGLSPETSVAVIRSAYFSDEEFITTTLGELKSVASPAIIVVGHVVAKGVALMEHVRKISPPPS